MNLRDKYVKISLKYGIKRGIFMLKVFANKKHGFITIFLAFSLIVMSFGLLREVAFADDENYSEGAEEGYDFNAESEGLVPDETEGDSDEMTEAEEEGEEEFCEEETQEEPQEEPSQDEVLPEEETQEESLGEESEVDLDEPSETEAFDQGTEEAAEENAETEAPNTEEPKTDELLIPEEATIAKEAVASSLLKATAVPAAQEKASQDTMSIQDDSAKEATKTETKDVFIFTTSVGRLGGSNQYTTAMKIADDFKKTLGVSKFSNIVIATGKNYPDALSGALLAKTKNAPILLISDKMADKVIAYIQANLKSNGTVYILGGEKAVSANIENKLSQYKTKRLWGQDQYGTNLAILKAVKADNYSDWLVATSANYYDAISASPVEQPLLLVGPTLYQNQTNYLSGLKNKKTFTIIGGPKAINTTVEKSLKNYGTVKRCYGENAYETSLAVANKYFKSKSKNAFIATGEHYADALTGGPLAMVRNAPMLLTYPNRLGYSYNYVVKNKITSVKVLGGEQAVPASLVPSGKAPGILTVGNKYKYIINEDGTMAQNQWTICNDIFYHVNQHGVINAKGSDGVLGIDVSQFQGTIDWKKVADSGIKWAMIRVGGRFARSGQLYDDDMYELNMQGALAAGIKVGVYYFTQAITEKEALEEANYTINKIKKYNITMPVVIDTEDYNRGRHTTKINKDQRTAIIKTFCEKVKSAGYKPGIYASKNWMETMVNANALKKYDLIVAQWAPQCTYQGPYVGWQYTDVGKVPGIKGYVDMDLWYGGTI